MREDHRVDIVLIAAYLVTLRDRQLDGRPRAAVEAVAATAR